MPKTAESSGRLLRPGLISGAGTTDTPGPRPSPVGGPTRAAFARHARDPAAGLLVPVMAEECTVPDLYAPLLRASLVDLGWRAAREALLAALAPKRPAGRWRLPWRRQPSPMPTAARTGVGAPFPALPPMCSLPARDPGFFGRDELLGGLHQRLRGGAADARGHRLVLHGMPGVGKTQLALEYAWRYRSDYQLLWWVDAGTAPTLQNGLLALAGVLGVDDSGDPEETCRRVCAELPSRLGSRTWLLIFDNVDDVDVLAALLPAGGHQLITSRSGGLVHGGHPGRSRRVQPGGDTVAAAPIHPCD